MRVASTRTGYRALRQWARRWPERRWAVENASGLGRSLAQWLRLKRETGGLAPKPVPGPAAVKTEALIAALPERLVEHADATLAEQCSWWQEVSGVAVSTATMSRALTRLDWTRKQSR